MLTIPPIGVLPKILGSRMQLGIVVRDLDAAMAYWTDTLKVGPFVVFENSVLGRKVTYRGKVTPLETSLAFSYLGDIQIELVWQANDAPSPYKDFLDSGREGLQHIGFWPERFDEACQELEGQGFREIFAMYLDDGSRNVAYYETPPHIGFTVELVPWTSARAVYFGRIKSIVDQWNGSRPVRRYRTRLEFLDSQEGLS
jgi:catechol 2,3-dioxygenase-like lactoylglutathione lyase family enzyme